MNCSTAKDCLSAYFDGELADEMRAAVAAHLAECSACAAELTAFDKLSDMSAALEIPQPPFHLWDDLEAKLDAEAVQPKRIPPPRRSGRSPTRLFALAATVLIAVGLSVVAYRTWLSPGGHDHLAVDFAHYLEDFDKRPEKAQQILLAKFDGSRTTLAEASAELGYEPLIAKGLPSGCVCKDMYLLKMPCCKCPQAVCKCDDGNYLAIFEHDEDQPMWFGDRPTVNCLCNGKPTDIVQIDDRLAATWKQGTRYLTVIGVKDTAEIIQLIAWFDDQKQGRTPL